MKLVQALILAIGCFAATEEATAQVTTDGKPCQEAFTTIQKEREKRGLAIKEAQAKKVERAEFCNIIKSYAAAESQLVKFMETNNAWCGIPPQAVAQIKTVYASTQKAQKTVCSGGGPVGGGAPPPPSLSDALGTSRVPDSTTTKPGRGTLDTLTGNPLGR
jgi:hypothetical protein